MRRPHRELFVLVAQAFADQKDVVSIRFSSVLNLFLNQPSTMGRSSRQIAQS